ncbi:hypothetical protein BHM03_00052004 [Ensete ventricosum]|nr:hypothetical protein BHM03_00052004 [Ensete ventricosum]
MDQNTRDIIMREFRSGSSRVLITTDLLARGIDVQQVSLVINYDLPTQPENYLHRIGRSGRFGRKGVAINFVTLDDERMLFDIQRFYNVVIEELPSNPSDPAAACARIFAFFCRGRAEDDLRLPYEEQEKDGAVANPDTFLLRWGYSRSSSDLIFSPSLGRSSSESLVSRRWGVRYALFSCLLILIFCSGSFLILASNLAFIGYDLDRVPSPSPSHASMWTSDSAADRTQNVAFFCCGVAEEGPSAAPMTGRRMEPSSQSFQSTWSVICA